MSMYPQEIGPIPAETMRVARAAYPKGSLAMRLRDELGGLYQDEQFGSLFPSRGQPAEAPWRLAIVLVLQYVEGLTDRQAAEAVRGRIDWKYALGLELADPGFDASVLTEFRERLVAGQAETLLLDVLLERCKQRGSIRAGGRQRTDSTHVLARVRSLSTLECVGETLRAALDDVALVAPDLVCPDRRQKVLPLIFARPLTGVDYALAKVGAIFTCVFAFSFLPQVVLYVGQMLVSDGALDYLRHNTAVLWQVPVACAVLALFYAVLSVSVASLSGRRIVAGATLLGITLVTSSVAAIILESGGPQGVDTPGQPAALLNVLALPLYVRDLVFLGRLHESSDLSGVTGGGALAVAAYLAVVGAGVAVLLWRYRSADA